MKRLERAARADALAESARAESSPAYSALQARIKSELREARQHLRLAIYYYLPAPARSQRRKTKGKHH
ncbi:MAG TPA: hypothetical protein VII30_01345 [Gemmatimonadaceae bacterium]